MVMIGAAARNVGKTGFACDLIRRRACEGIVIGVKITTVLERFAGCPRGGSGCGVCDSLSAGYEIAEETRCRGGKDTERMLAAGAARVFWLRVHPEHMAEAVQDLLRQIPHHAAIVCESNSARTAVAPGVFLAIRGKGLSAVKPSCLAVMGSASRVVTFDGRGWDLLPERVVFANRRWLIRQDATAIILAGGQSRRMGTDKSLLPVAGEPMVQHIARQLSPAFDELLIGANDTEKFGFLNVAVVPDLEPDQGPLMGLLSCLERSSHDLNFVTGCDMPHVDLDLVQEMVRAADGLDIVMPLSPSGKFEPLFALYRRSVIGPARIVLGRGGRRIAHLFDHVKVKFVPLSSEDSFSNLNTAEDYQAALGAEASEICAHERVTR
jgi:molybdopterin-guanine dinucleotide biosynthesis protein A